jgi:hypothetical protein
VKWAKHSVVSTARRWVEWTEPRLVDLWVRYWADKKAHYLAAPMAASRAATMVES